MNYNKSIPAMSAKTNEDKRTMPGVVLPLTILVLGIILLVLNIYIEDEPGGVPLLIIAISAGWLTFRYVKLRLRKRNA